MKDKKKMNINRIKKQQFIRYSSFEIPEKILEEIFDEVAFYKDENDIVFNFNIKMGEFIVEQIKNENIDIEINVIENYAYVKKLIIKNTKYELSKEEINNVYEQAIDNLKESYNNKELLGTNIVTNMKKIILGKNNLKKKVIKEEYDISFFKEYIDSYEIDKKAYSSAFDISEDDFQDLLEGKKKMNKEDLYLLCSLFGVDTFDELKEIVNEKVKFHKQKEELLKRRQLLQNHILKNDKPIFKETNNDQVIIKNEKKEKQALEEKEEIIETLPIKKEELKITDKNNIVRYNLSFIKEYAMLYNLTLKDLATKLHCGIGKVDDILSGKLLIKESVIEDIAYEFGASDFDDLYNKITDKIQTKRDNIKAKSLTKNYSK